jgi:hypothetical protein
LAVDSSGSKEPSTSVTANTSLDVAPSSGRRLLAGLFHVPRLAARVTGKETVRIGRRDVPLWLFGAAVGALFMGPVLVLSVTHVGRNTPAPDVTVVKPPPELDEIIQKAEAGDPGALADLAARPEGERTAGEWMAIARGDAKLSRNAAALEAFARAVPLDVSLAGDETLLALVRRAADDEALRSRAFDVSATVLGASGADVLFDVWTSTTQKTEATTLAKTLLERDDVRAHASPALRLALDLRRTTKCEDVKDLVARAKEVADERASRRLTQLNSRRGCGFLSLSDCFSCLRKTDDLAQAIKAAQTRKAPSF